MPIFNYKCSECSAENEFLVGATTGGKAPTECPECGAKDCMEKQFSASGISGEVVGGYEYEYGKKAWKKNLSPMEQAGVLAGDRDPY